MSGSSVRRFSVLPWRLPLAWPHLVWLGLLVYTDAQLWFTRAGLYSMAPAETAPFWRNALLADVLDCALFYLNYLVLQPQLFRPRRGLAYLGAVVGALLLFALGRVAVSVAVGEGSPLTLSLAAQTHLMLGGLILLLSAGLRLAHDYW